MSGQPISVQGALGALAQLIDSMRAESVSLRREFCEHVVHRNADLLAMTTLDRSEAHEHSGATLKRWTWSDDAMMRGFAAHENGLAERIHDVETIIEGTRSLWNEADAKLRTAEQRCQNLSRELSDLTQRLKEHALHNANVRETVWAMTDGRCFHCEVKLIRNGEAEQATDRSRVFHIDHLVPKASGGPDHISNYVPACERCNISKGAKSYVEFIALRKAQQQPLTVIEGGVGEVREDLVDRVLHGVVG